MLIVCFHSSWRRNWSVSCCDLAASSWHWQQFSGDCRASKVWGQICLKTSPRKNNLFSAKSVLWTGWLLGWRGYQQKREKVTGKGMSGQRLKWTKTVRDEAELVSCSALALLLNPMPALPSLLLNAKFDRGVWKVWVRGRTASRKCPL